MNFALLFFPGPSAISDLQEGSAAHQGHGNLEPDGDCEENNIWDSSEEEEHLDDTDEKKELAGRRQRFLEEDEEIDDLDYHNSFLAEKVSAAKSLDWDWNKDEDLTPQAFPESTLTAKNLDIGTPTDFYLAMLGSDTIDLVTCETNRARAQNHSNTKDFSKDEIAKFLGILIYRSLVKLPSFSHYWSTESQINAVIGAMSRNRFTVR